MRLALRVKGPEPRRHAAFLLVREITRFFLAADFAGSSASKPVIRTGARSGNSAMRFKKQAPSYEDDIAAEAFFELTFNPADKLDMTP